MRDTPKPLHILSKISMVSTVIGLMGAIVYLSVSQYRSQIALRQTAQTQVVYDSERRATALGYFFAEQQDFLRELSRTRELSAYFENKALGMSWEYGLRASILQITAHLEEARQSKRLGNQPMYQRLVLLDAAGELLSDSNAWPQQEEPRKNWGAFLTPRRSEPAILCEKNGSERQILVSAPCFFKEKYAGQVLGWISLRQIYQYFIQVEGKTNRYPDVLLFGHEYLYLPEALRPVLPPSLPADMAQNKAYRFPAGAGSYATAIRVPVNNSPFSIMTVIPPSEQFDLGSPRQLLFTTGGLALFIVAGMFILVRLNTHNAVLRAHLQETSLRERAVEEKNLELASEVQERYSAQQLLLAERDFVRSLFETAQVIMLVLDCEGCIVRFNPYLEEISGYQLAEVQGQQWFSAFAPAEKAEELAAAFQETLGSSRARQIYYPILTKDGRRREIEWHEKPLRDREGRLVGLLSTGQDITDQKKMELERLKWEKLESLGVLAGGLAHDFNNILTGISGNISLAKTMLDPASDVFPRLAACEGAALRASDLTKQLLTFAKGGAPIRVAASITDIMRDSAEFALSGSRVRCEFSMPPDLWPVEVDAGQISQVIHNLFLNADQAMPRGGVIQLRCENASVGALDGLPLKPGRYVKVAIADQGGGIPEENLGRIFDPYFTTKASGNGLGLASSFSIIKRHEGLITVDTVEGKGTTFFVYLPAADKGLESCESTDEPGAGPKKARILVMDDEQVVRDVLGDMLRSLGHEVEFSHEGEEAIERYRSALAVGTRFDLVIMDLTIPGGMGGKEALDNLRELDLGVKAVVSSGYSNDQVMAHYQEYGFSGVIRKPFRLEELREVLRILHC